MEHAESAIRHNISCLRECSELILSTPELWDRWWRLRCACNAAAARLERRLSRLHRARTEILHGKVIDLSAWRRCKAEALAWADVAAGDAHDPG